MEENVQSAKTEEVVTKTPFSAKVKEWFRKKIVNLKRRPNNIPLVLYCIVSVIYMAWLGTFSQAIYPVRNADGMSWTGLFLFINVLLSILVIVCIIYAFPKRSKPKLLFLILAAVMTIAMIGCDIGYYVIADAYDVSGTSVEVYMNKSLNYTIAHIVMLGVCGIIFALLPVYSRLIKKIDTSVKVESATENISSGAIDIQED